MAEAGVLTLKLCYASNLKDKDLFGKQDPYVKINVSGQTVRSATHHNGGKNPVWNEVFRFNIMPGDKFALLEIFDEDTFKDDLVGTATIDLSQARGKGVAMVSAPVLKPNGKQRGTIAVELEFQSSGPKLSGVPPAPAPYVAPQPTGHMPAPPPMAAAHPPPAQPPPAGKAPHGYPSEPAKAAGGPAPAHGYPAPPPHGYPPPQPGYPAQGYPPQQPHGSYPPQQQHGGYPPQQQQGGYPPHGYPPQPQQGGYPPHGYPPQAQAYGQHLPPGYPAPPPGYPSASGSSHGYAMAPGKPGKPGKPMKPHRPGGGGMGLGLGLLGGLAGGLLLGEALDDIGDCGDF